MKTGKYIITDGTIALTYVNMRGNYGLCGCHCSRVRVWKTIRGASAALRRVRRMSLTAGSGLYVLILRPSSRFPFAV